MLTSEQDLAEIQPDYIVLDEFHRGGTVDTEALIHTLQACPTFGAVLDAFEEEPLDPNSPLWDMPNAILTPHNSFVGSGNGKRLRKLIMNGSREGRCK